MLPWSDNVRKQPSFVTPKKLDPSDFAPAQRSFPFADTNTIIPADEADEADPDGVLGFSPVADPSLVQCKPFVEIGPDYVTFRMQRGPIKEHGVNGCQIDDLIKFVADTIFVLNKKFPCRENSLAITKLEEAWLWCKARTLDREARNVEGRDLD